MRSFSLVLFATALAACSPFDPNLGGTSYKCGSTDPKCPDGYTCQTVGADQRCVSDDGAGPDAPISGFQCAQDDFETAAGSNNNSTGTATPLNLPSIVLGPVSLCPSGDKDTYSLNVASAGSMMEAVVTWESGMPVGVSILGAGGQLFNMGTANGTANSVRAYVAQMPQGTAFVQVSAATGVQNNYRLTVMITQ